MKTKLLKKLRKKWRIVGSPVHVIKYIYSLYPLSRHPVGEPDMAKWTTYSFDNAINKQREMIINNILLMKQPLYNQLKRKITSFYLINKENDIYNFYKEY
jgi:hypothetical protein